MVDFLKHEGTDSNQKSPWTRYCWQDTTFSKGSAKISLTLSQIRHCVETSVSHQPSLPILGIGGVLWVRAIFRARSPPPGQHAKICLLFAIRLDEGVNSWIEYLISCICICLLPPDLANFQSLATAVMITVMATRCGLSNICLRMCSMGRCPGSVRGGSMPQL